MFLEQSICNVQSSTSCCGNHTLACMLLIGPSKIMFRSRRMLRDQKQYYHFNRICYVTTGLIKVLGSKFYPNANLPPLKLKFSHNVVKREQRNSQQLHELFHLLTTQTSPVTRHLRQSRYSWQLTSPSWCQNPLKAHDWIFVLVLKFIFLYEILGFCSGVSEVPFFWEMTLRYWVSDFRRFETT